MLCQFLLVCFFVFLCLHLLAFISFLSSFAFFMLLKGEYDNVVGTRPLEAVLKDSIQLPNVLLV